MKVKTNFGDYDGCFLELNTYAHSNSVCIDIVSKTEGPLARITTCLIDDIPESFGFVDTNNCPWAEDFINEFGLGIHTGMHCESGFCSYPLYEFNMDKLKEYA